MEIPFLLIQNFLGVGATITALLILIVVICFREELTMIFSALNWILLVMMAGYTALFVYLFEPPFTSFLLRFSAHLSWFALLLTIGLFISVLPQRWFSLDEEKYVFGTTSAFILAFMSSVYIIKFFV